MRRLDAPAIAPRVEERRLRGQMLFVSHPQMGAGHSRMAQLIRRADTAQPLGRGATAGAEHVVTKRAQKRYRCCCYCYCSARSRDLLDALAADDLPGEPATDHRADGVEHEVCDGFPEGDGDEANSLPQHAGAKAV